VFAIFPAFRLDHSDNFSCWCFIPVWARYYGYSLGL